MHGVVAVNGHQMSIKEGVVERVQAQDLWTSVRCSSVSDSLHGTMWPRSNCLSDIPVIQHLPPV